MALAGAMTPKMMAKEKMFHAPPSLKKSSKASTQGRMLLK